MNAHTAEKDADDAPPFHPACDKFGHAWEGGACTRCRADRSKPTRVTPPAETEGGAA